MNAQIINDPWLKGFEDAQQAFFHQSNHEKLIAEQNEVYMNGYQHGWIESVRQHFDQWAHQYWQTNCDDCFQAVLDLLKTVLIDRFGDLPNDIQHLISQGSFHDIQNWFFHAWYVSSLDELFTTQGV